MGKSIKVSVLCVLFVANLSAIAQGDIAILDEYENGKKKYVMVERNDTNIFRSYYQSGVLKYECYNETTDTFYAKIGNPVIDSIPMHIRSCSLYTMWNEEGNKTEQGELLKGEMHGWVKFFNSAGKVEKERLFDRGQLLDRKDY